MPLFRPIIQQLADQCLGLSIEKGEPYGDLQLITKSLAGVAIATGWTEPRGSVYYVCQCSPSVFNGIRGRLLHVVILCRRRDEPA